MNISQPANIHTITCLERLTFAQAHAFAAQSQLTESCTTTAARHDCTSQAFAVTYQALCTLLPCIARQVVSPGGNRLSRLATADRGVISITACCDDGCGPRRKAGIMYGKSGLLQDTSGWAAPAATGGHVEA